MPPPSALVAPSVATAASTAVAVAAEPTRERSLGRFTARDYTYVRRELTRILIFAAAMLVLIFVLSFFLP